MDFRVVQGSLEQQQADCLVVGHFEGETAPTAAAAALDRALDGALTALLDGGDFAGKSGSSVLLYTFGRVPAARVLLVGLGKAADFDGRALRKAAASAARALRSRKGVGTVAALLPGDGAGAPSVRQAAQRFAEATALALYRVPNYKREQPEGGIESVALVDVDAARGDELRAGLAEGQIVAEAVRTARDLSNEPPNVLNPVELAARARAMADRVGLRCTVLGEQEMAAEKMGILLAVSRGSANEAQFIILEHAPAGRAEEAPLVLVGKGVTFDTGGISIKPSERMEEMKHDMSGAAAVVGAMEAIARLDLPRRVIGVAVCVENMPGGNAFRPGDILTGITGKSCEILSTDAEGRLILADAMGYVARFQPAVVVDLATLTGAIGVALGPHAAGLFYNDETVKEALLDASDASGERLWPMPLYDEYMETIKGDMGEVKNTGGRTGGVGTSAKFIEHFTEGYPWAHLDIASVAWTNSDKEPLNPKGATGYGVRLLVELARQSERKAADA